MDNYRIKSYLMEGENVLWEGDAGNKVSLSARRGGQLFQIIFGWMFFGFALAWTIIVSLAMATTGSFSVVMPVLGVPFMIAGLFVAFGGIATQKMLYKDCVYVATDRRVVAFTKKNVRSMEYENMEQPELIYGKNDSDRGWLILKKTTSTFEVPAFSSNARASVRVNTSTSDYLILQDIKDVTQAYKIIVDARDRRRNGKTDATQNNA